MPAARTAAPRAYHIAATS